MRRPISSVSSGAGRRLPPTRPEETQDAARDDRAELAYLAYALERSKWEALRSGRQYVRYAKPSGHESDDGYVVGDEDGPRVRPPKKKTWSLVAEWMDARRLPFLDFTGFTFDMLVDETNEEGDLRIAPEPLALRSDAMASAWREALAGERSRVADALAAQNNRANGHAAVYRHAGFTITKAWLVTLSTLTLELSPLYRYCIAHLLRSPEFDEVATLFRDDAVLQFVRHQRAYGPEWAKILPVGFEASASETYPRVIKRFLAGRR